MGRSAALQMAQKGADVIIVSRNADKLAGVVAEMKVSHHHPPSYHLTPSLTLPPPKAIAPNPSTQRFHFLTADVSQEDYAPPLLDAAVAWNGGRDPDIVWCVAGMSTPDLWFEAPLALSRRQMDVNYWGAAEMAHAILRRWCAAQKDGEKKKDEEGKEDAKHLIFTSSVLAFLPFVGYGPYTPAKSALRGLADTLNQEVGLYPGAAVRIHVVYPGSIGSPGLDRENVSKPEVTKEIEAGDPVLSPDEVARQSIAGLEGGGYAVVPGSLTCRALRWSALGGSERNGLWGLRDTVAACLVHVAWLFVLPDIFGVSRRFARERGHPGTYRKSEW